MAEGQRPGAATGAAVLAIIFGALGALFGLLAVVGSGVIIAAMGTIGVLLMILSIITLGVAVLGLIGGIMMLGNKKGGYTLTLVYAIVALIANVVSFVLTIVAGSPPNIVGLIFGAVVPVIVLILLMMKPVKDFYAKAA